jgi:hypothetical protein
MALTTIQPERLPWMSPRWPAVLPAAESLRAVYGADADELTIRFPNTPERDIVVVWLATPRIEYAGLMVHEHSGAVVGVQVDYLEGYTQAVHPTWLAAGSEPAPKVASAIVDDVKQLHERFGLLRDSDS